MAPCPSSLLLLMLALASLSLCGVCALDASVGPGGDVSGQQVGGGGVPAAAGAAGAAGGAPPPPRAPADASKLLSAGEREFRAKAYDVSIRLLGEALAASGSDASLRAKVLYARHKAYMSQQRLPQAIADLSAVCELDGKHVLARLQRANLQLMTGRCAEAVADYAAVLALDGSKRDAHARMPHATECKAALERAEQARASRNPDALRAALTEAVGEGRATSAPALLMERAQAYLQLGGEENNVNALADLARVLKMDANNVPAYALRGKALMMHGDFATARAHYQAGLQMDPEHSDCKAGYRLAKSVVKAKEGGDEALGRGAWAEAVDIYSASLELDGGLHLWRRECLLKLTRALWRGGRVAEAKASARRMVSWDDGSAEAHNILAEALMREEAWEEANREAHRAHEMDRGNHEFRDTAQRAEAALKQSKSKDYYKILGVPRSAGEAEFKRAYRKLALEWHPDKVAEEQKEAASKKFQDIGEAYEVLSSAELKAKYDRGEDVFGGSPGGGGGGGGHGHGFPGGHPFHQGGFNFHFRNG